MRAFLATLSDPLFAQVVIPGFNAVTQQVFSQINDTFKRGTKEYLHHVETELNTTRNALFDSLKSSAKNLDLTSVNLGQNFASLKSTIEGNIDVTRR